MDTAGAALGTLAAGVSGAEAKTARTRRIATPHPAPSPRGGEGVLATARRCARAGTIS